MNYHYLECILQDSSSASRGSDSDLSYVLRKMITKGIKDAEYRSFWCSTDRATIYKDMMLELEAFLEVFEETSFNTMISTYDGRQLIMDQVKLCECLASLDLMEGRADFDMMVAELTRGASVSERSVLTSFV